ncbi:MAG: hypothetical protein WC781_05405 [Candidatus Pacearchaeota archaeon]|jgi:hypothetical protein
MVKKEENLIELVKEIEVLDEKVKHLDRKCVDYQINNRRNCELNELEEDIIKDLITLRRGFYNLDPERKDTSIKTFKLRVNKFIEKINENFKRLNKISHEKKL